MSNDRIIMKRTLTILLFSLLLLPGYKTVQAQTDTDFWFAVPKLSQSHDWDRRRFYIRVATLDLPATITISMPATPGFTPMVFDVPANTALTVPLLSDQAYDYTNLAAINANGVEEYIFRMWNEFPNQVYNRGVRITSTNLITAYFEVGTINNPDIFSLKGRNSLGRDFFVPFQNVHYNQPLATRPYSGIYIVAIEDNTRVTITPTRPVFPGRPAGVPFDVILNRGQSIGIAPDDYNNTGQSAANHLGGTRVQSTKPIAVTTSDDSVRGLPGGCYDLIGDQLIPTTIIGTEYIAMKGRLQANLNEGFYVTGTQPNTQVYVDGTLVAMIGPGQMYRHTFTQQNHHIRTSEPTYVYHVGGFGCEQGGAVLPPVNVCTGSTEVAFTRSKGESFFLNILVRKGAQDAFYFNGDGPNTVIRASDFVEVPGSTDWLAAEFEFTQAMVPIGRARLVRNTKDVFHLAIINGGTTTGTMYGYFSDFNELNVRANISGAGGITKSCFGEPIQLWARGGTSYSWHPPDFLSNPLINNPVALPDTSIKYTVTVSGACGMRDSTSVTILLADPVKAMFTVDESVGCAPFPVTISDKSIGVSNYSWVMGDGTQYTYTSDYQATEFTHIYRNQTDTAQRRNLRLIARNVYACRDTVETTITVYPEIKAQLTASTIIGCAPLDVDFGNLSTGAAGYLWDMGDGATSKDTILTHTFHNYTDNDTIFRVVLKAISAYGCIDFDTIDILVKPYIKTGFSFDPPVHCNPYPIEITNTSIGAITNTWSFDGGITMFETDSLMIKRLLENNTDAPKLFEIWLYGENNSGCRDSIMRPVTVYPPLESKFTASVVEGCNPLTVQFTNNSIGANNYLWNFDLGEGTSSDPNPLVVFDNLSPTDTAFFNVRLFATSEFFCRDTSSVEIIVYPRLKASFTFDYVSYCLTQAGEIDVEFHNNSTGGLNYYWDFGDGNFSQDNSATIVHTFTNTTSSDRTYKVRLMLENETGCIDILERDIVIFPRVRADFNMTMAGCHPFVVDFENRSVGAAQYIWDLGDGGSSQMPELTRIYTNISHISNEYYTIKLMAISEYGCLDSLSKDIVVYPKPFADFEPSVVSGCAPLEVGFNNLALGNSLRSHWDFGDGNNLPDTQGDAAHVYYNKLDSAVIFTSRLIVANAQGCRDTVTRTVNVFPEINSAFTLSQTSGCHPLELRLLNQSTGASATTPYIWEYGDGQQSTTQELSQDYVFNNFSHTQNKYYTIRLLSESKYGCKSVEEQNIVVYPRPAASFQPDILEGCSPLDVGLNDSSMGAINYRWNYGDGNSSERTGSNSHLFNQAHDAGIGMFDIHLRVSNSHGCWDTITRQVMVYPDITADFHGVLDGCHPFEVELENKSLGVFENIWSFGDGSSTNTVDPTHVYINESFSQSANYTLSLTTISEYGCQANKTSQVRVRPRPKSDFSIDSHQGCSPLRVGFRNLSEGGRDHTWNFGGSNETNNVIGFERVFRNLEDEPVIYNLRLTATNEFGCARESVQELKVFPEVEAEFTADNPELAGCSPLNLNFENLSLKGHEYHWNFADGTLSTAGNPSNTFFTPSNTHTEYPVQLIVNSVYGCTSTITRRVRVFPVPVADIFVSPHTQEYPSATIAAQNLSAPGEWSYTWDMGDDTRYNTTNRGTINHEYIWGDDDYSTRHYRVMLHVANEFCHDTISQKVTILAPYPVVGFSPSAQGCPPLEVQFRNDSKFGYEFHWDFRDGNTSAEENPVHIFTDPGEYRVRLQVKGEGGLDSAYQVIRVFEPPIADFRVTPEYIQIPYDWAKMVNLSSLATYYEWHLGDGTVTYEYEPVYQYQTPGDYDITLIVATDTDPQCFDQVTKKGAILVEQPCKIIFPNAFTPNSTGPTDGRYVVNDPANNVFYPIHTGLMDYRLEIYNRWGEFIFRSTDVNIGWDGYYRGKLSAMDVYVWKVWATCFSGKEIREAGDVTLYR
jgi:PKD repeat protein